MKKNQLMQTAICTLAAGMLFSTVSATSIARAADSDDFHQKLAQLIQAEDSSSYFGMIELTVGQKSLKIDGKTQEIDCTPEIQDGVLMLPLRPIAEAAGAEVHYNREKKSAVITSARGEQAICPIGVPSVTVESKVYSSDQSSYIKQGRTYLSAQTLSQAMELEIDWDQTANTIEITAPYQTARLIVTMEQQQKLDTSGFQADPILYDGNGLWILQFQTPSAAKEAAQVLTEKKINVEADQYMPGIIMPENQTEQPKS